jgi:hypothetical protein
VTPLQPQRHEPPAGWPPEVFKRLTDALAAALVASYRRHHASEECGSCPSQSQTEEAG